MNNTKTEQKILEMEAHLATESRNMLFSSFVNKKQVEEHLEDLKEAITEDLAELNEIKLIRERIILEAQEEADRLRQQVRVEIEQQEIAVQAREVAREIIQAAKTEAKTVLSEAKELRNQLIVNSHKYVDTLFESFDKEMIETQEKISENREQMRSAREQFRTSLEKKMELMQESHH